MSIQPGIPILCGRRMGTLGLIVTRGEDPKKYLLSCKHLLDYTFASGLVLSPNHNNVPIARYDREHQFSLPLYDAAIAELIEPQAYPANNRIVTKRRSISEAAYFKRKIKLRKVGAATLQTTCRLIKNSSFSGFLKEGIVLKKYKEDDLRFCAPGDSGAIWCSMKNQGVAMHVSGGYADGSARAAPLQAIIEELNLVIV